jgi:hypothetical protein
MYTFWAETLPPKHHHSQNKTLMKQSNIKILKLVVLERLI